MFLKNKNIIFKIRRSKVTDYAALRGSYKVLEINIAVCPRLESDDISLIICLGYDFYIYGAFEFLCNSIVYL